MDFRLYPVYRSHLDILYHLVEDHVSDLTSLPIFTIKQGKSCLLPVLQGLATDGEEQMDDYRPNSPVVSSRQASQGVSQPLPPPMLLTSEDEEVTLLPPDDPTSWLQEMFDWMKSWYST